MLAHFNKKTTRRFSILMPYLFIGCGEYKESNETRSQFLFISIVIHESVP